MRSLFIAAVAALAILPSAASATIAYNGAPADGWFFGNGNDYTPANTTVFTADDNSGDQLYLRWHETGTPAPISVGNVYSFALGTTPLSFDWGVNIDATRLNGQGGFRNVTGNITVTNLGTGQSASYDPFFCLGGPICNDNTIGLGNAQNSARLTFGFLSGANFTPNVDSSYRVTLSISGLASGTQTLSTDAQIGAGAGAVPEPASWAMMVGGFGLIGGALRRRRVTVRFA